MLRSILIVSAVFVLIGGIVGVIGYRAGAPRIAIGEAGFVMQGDQTFVNMPVTNLSEKPVFLLLSGAERKVKGRWVEAADVFKAAGHNLGRHNAGQGTPVQVVMPRMEGQWRLKVRAYYPVSRARESKASIERFLQRVTGKTDWLKFWNPPMYDSGREFYTREFSG